MSKEPNFDAPSDLESWIESLSQEVAHFYIRLSDGRPTLVFKKTGNWDELEEIKRRVKKAVQAVAENNCPAEWKKFIGQSLVPVGHAEWMANRHVGYLKWVDCDEPAEPGPTHRQLGEQWQEEILIPAKSETLTFLKMSHKDPLGFQSLSQAFFENVGVSWTSDDARYFRRQEEAIPDGSF